MINKKYFNKFHYETLWPLTVGQLIQGWEYRKSAQFGMLADWNHQWLIHCFNYPRSTMLKGVIETVCVSLGKVMTPNNVSVNSEHTVYLNRILICTECFSDWDHQWRGVPAAHYDRHHVCQVGGWLHHTSHLSFPAGNQVHSIPRLRTHRLW